MLIGKQFLETREVAALGQTVVVISLLPPSFHSSSSSPAIVTDGDISRISCSSSSASAEITKRPTVVTRFPADKTNIYFRKILKIR